MRTILYLAVSANGFIADKEGEESFVSPEDWARFVKKVGEIGNVIIGRKTYELMKQTPEFGRMKKSDIVVLSRTKNLKNKNCTFASSPKEALSILVKKKHRQALVGGGQSIATEFMKSGLINEIFLNVMPAIIGKGIMLFAESDFDAKLKLLEIKKLSENELQLHYRVVK